MSVSSRQPSQLIEDRIKLKAKIVRDRNNNTTSSGNPLESGTMSGSSMVLTLADSTSITILNVDTDAGFDHFTAGSAGVVVSQAEAIADWNNV